MSIRMVMLIIIVIALIGFAVGGLAGAPWVPMRQVDVEKILDDCRLPKGGILIELGCGDGRLLKAAAKRNIKAIGYEINPLMWLIAWVINIRYYPKVRVRLGNFWWSDWRHADAVVTFLVPRSMSRLEQKAKQELKQGARLLSYVFVLPNKKAVKKHDRWYVYDY